MNFTEAFNAVEKLYLYQGKVMKPFLVPVKKFLIVPAKQHEFDQMFNEMQNNKISFERALQPYKDDVTILVCFDMTPEKEEAAYCHFDYFLFDNKISI